MTPYQNFRGMSEERTLGADTPKVKIGQYLIEDISDETGDVLAVWNIFDGFDRQIPMVLRGSNTRQIKLSLGNAYSNISEQAATWYFSGIMDGFLHLSMKEALAPAPAIAQEGSTDPA